MKNKILVIDDSETNNLLVKSILEENKDILVYTLSNSKIAFKLIDKIKPDLILLDMMMPDVDGIEILKGLKRKNLIKKYPTIVVSANQDYDLVKEALSLGAVEYIEKPIGNNKLFNKVEKFFSNKLIKSNI